MEIHQRVNSTPKSARNVPVHVLPPSPRFVNFGSPSLVSLHLFSLGGIETSESHHSHHGSIVILCNFTSGFSFSFLDVHLLMVACWGRRSSRICDYVLSRRYTSIMSGNGVCIPLAVGERARLRSRSRGGGGDARSRCESLLRSSSPSLS
ncbi:hypothetical protein DL93DRAFT_130342 [Clavulina sp. PMI_390]|nr:hypothetical protein DL93DRAFT_130342 [Clavulina sp. PMI_390]